MPLTPWPMIVALALLLLGPCVAAALLRWAGMNSGSSILGGILAGILMGPTVAGRVTPTRFKEAMHGVHEDQAARERIVARQNAELLVAEHQELTLAETRALRQRHAQELVVIDLQIQDAIFKHQQPFRVFVMVLAAVVLMSSGADPVRKVGQIQHWVHALGAGLMAAVIPAGLAFAACRTLWQIPLDDSLMAAAAISIGPWILSSTDRAAADDVEIGGSHMIQSAGRIASVFAIVIASIAIFLHGGQRDLWVAAPLLVMPVGWVTLRWLTNPKLKSMLVAFNERLLLPSLAASTMMAIDFTSSVHVCMVLVVLLLSDDGRWFGAFLGAMSLGGRKPLRTMRLVLGCMSAGPNQLALTGWGVWFGLLSPRLALPLLLGAALIEATAPLRRRLADKIADLEHNIDQDESRGDV